MTPTRYRRAIAVAVIVAALAVALAIVSAVRAPSLEATPVAAQEPVAARQLREFHGAYPARVAARGGVVEVALEARATTVPMLDGSPLEVWAYNGQVPGPTLRVRRGDTLRVTFTNRLPQSTTIHWHGVRVPNAMDGVPHVTQPPVDPGDTFVYEFVLKDAGTFWYHPHLRSSEQVERGLHGILVVDDVEPPPYDQDVVWALDDWRLGPDGAIDPAFNTRHDLAHNGRWGNVLTVNGSVYERLVVRPGERVRLRLLDVANGRVFAPDFSGLDAQVIAVDGLYTARPLTLDRLELAPGNRLDLDIRFTAAQRGKTFTIVDRFTRRPLELATIVVADVEPVSTATFPSPAAQHVPRWHEAAALPPTLEYRLNARRGGELGIEWTMNDVAFTHADHAAHAPSGSLALGQFSKVRFVNQSARIHPMHLHGTFFRLLARNGQPVDEPFFRDTVLLRARESVDIGLVPLDEGRWMVHCHILEHAESGMMTLIAVEPAPDTQPL